MTYRQHFSTTNFSILDTKNMIFNFMKFIGLRTNIHLFIHAALYLLSYLLNTCVSCEWYTRIYSKKLACQKRNLGKYLHICILFSYDIGSLLNYSIQSVFGNFCFNWSFNVFVKLPIMTSEFVRRVSVSYIT